MEPHFFNFWPLFYCTCAETATSLLLVYELSYLWDPLRTRAIPERLRGVITTRRYTNPRLPYLTLPGCKSPKISPPGVVMKRRPTRALFLVTSFSVQSTDMEWDITNVVKIEMQLYNSSGNQGRWLERAYSYLMSIGLQLQSLHYLQQVFCALTCAHWRLHW